MQIEIVTTAELSAILAELSALRAEVQRLQPPAAPELMTAAEACKELSISRRTLDMWARAGKLTKAHTAVGVRYRRWEVDGLKKPIL
jgi:excisionase family DNA binding protein